MVRIAWEILGDQERCAAAAAFGNAADRLNRRGVIPNLITPAMRLLDSCEGGEGQGKSQGGLVQP